MPYSLRSLASLPARMAIGLNEQNKVFGDYCKTTAGDTGNVMLKINAICIFVQCVSRLMTALWSENQHITVV